MQHFLIFEAHILFTKVKQFWKSLDYSPMFIQEAMGHSVGIWVLSNRKDMTFTHIDSVPQCTSFFPWLGHPDYEDIVKKAWQIIRGDVLSKLQGVKESKLDLFSYYDLIQLEKDLQLQYNPVLDQEEILWFQKCRENWVKIWQQKH
ncbi:hypothetical protein HKD37_10G029922 [Glycine soja]